MKTKIKYHFNQNYIRKKVEINFYRNKRRYIHFKDLLRNYVELENRLKAVEGNFLINNSENKTDVHYFEGFQKLNRYKLIC